jgi:predicted alpha-1,2-mannosidase
MKKSFFLGLIACGMVGITSCSTNANRETDLMNLTANVDPFIGTGDHGHVFMGANVPFGFIQAGPTQHSQGWDWCSGYHYSDSIIIGFGHTHLNGTGIGDLGDVALMPVIGEVQTVRGDVADGMSGIGSRFSHQNETAKAGYYKVHLERFGIDVELTATARVGFHKYTFPKSDDARVIFDLEHGIGWDAPLEGFITLVNDTIVTGYRLSQGWAKDQRVYFTAHFSKPMKEFQVFNGTERQNSNTVKARQAYGQAVFDTKAGEELYVKVALSPVSIENAEMNMAAELPSWDFKNTAAIADRLWNEQLNKIQIESGNTSDVRKFYTALYHTMIAPSVFCDVNGDYRGADANIYKGAEFVNYTTFSLWDTYRAAHPLMTIIHPEKASDIAQSFLKIYEQQGKLPVWHLMGNETDCMVGNPGIPVLADLVLKGYNVDATKALDAMKASALLNERGLGLLKEYGYIPYDKEPTHESVAKGLEYALADWCVAQVAQKAGNSDDYAYFAERSKSYRHYFDSATRFVRGKSTDGKFREPFNPFRSTHREDDYTEGNAWQYTWLVPHDVRGLIELFGSDEAFVAKLDSLFTVEGDMGDEASPDISGLIGQYAHGNEPSHHVLYLYPYAGQPWKTASKVRQTLSTLYSDAPAGLSGNEDVGQMSAWYILSSLGFYQVEPAGGKYIFGSPAVDKAVLRIGDKMFTIVAHNNSSENIYIQSVKLNGAPYTKSYITHSDIAAGGTLEFEMGSTPSATFGAEMKDRP